MDSVVFELCAQTLEHCNAAEAGGAQRIELCSHLEVGGLTPEASLMGEILRRIRLPVHILIRPHAETFAYDSAAFDAMIQNIRTARQLGAAGVVAGVLHRDGRMDVERTHFLVREAGPLEFTFHRAFDETPDLLAALEDAVASGCGRILTSGGAPDVLSGTPMLARLVQQARRRVSIAAGGGLRLRNAKQVQERSGATHFHGSLLHEDADVGPLAQRVRGIVQLLNQP